MFGRRVYGGPVDLAWQPSLLDGPALAVDPAFAGRLRHELGAGAWVDVVPGWLSGADALFDELLHATAWAQREVRMYERTLPEPRLTHRWSVAPSPVLEEARGLLSGRYGVEFTQVGANLYRDGADSVAWHGDRVARERDTAVVALVSLGGVRPFRLRPKGGGASVGFLPAPGDLLVMGGTCQRTWQHGVPKVRSAAPRISVQFRHLY
jgi:alkylated DNA repair dioxygenase AlkB